jgi:hypothetical protein
MCNSQRPISKLPPERERHARSPGIGLGLGRMADRGLDPIEADLASIHPLLGMLRETDWTVSRAAGHGRNPSYCANVAAMGIPSSARPTRSRRIGRCRLTLCRRAENAKIVTNGAFVRNAILPFNHETSEQLPLWQERVRLDEGFFQSLIEHPLPIREAAIRQISNRSMAIDLYIWLAYRLHAPRGPVEVSWQTLRRQFGESYGELWFFRCGALSPLKLVQAVYPEAKVNVDERTGHILYPSPPRQRTEGSRPRHSSRPPVLARQGHALRTLCSPRSSQRLWPPKSARQFIDKTYRIILETGLW